MDLRECSEPQFSGVLPWHPQDKTPADQHQLYVGSRDPREVPGSENNPESPTSLESPMSSLIQPSWGLRTKPMPEGREGACCSD